MTEIAIQEPLAARAAVRHAAWRWRDLRAYALLAPSLVFLGAFTYWPVAQVLWNSVHEQDKRAATFVGLKNYLAIFADTSFRHAFVNNLLYAAGTIIPSLGLALGFALALDRSSRLNTFLRSVLFLPVLVPLVAAASIFLFIFLPGVGLLDHYLARLGVAGVNWIGDPDVALASIIGLTVWKNAGYYMLFFLAGLQAIALESYEAAILDGANAWQRLWYVTLPALRPTVAFVVVIALINVVTQVDHIFVLTKGGPSDSTNLILFYIYQEAVERYDIGKASAATVIALIILLAISGFSLRRVDREAEA